MQYQSKPGIQNRVLFFNYFTIFELTETNINIAQELKRLGINVLEEYVGNTGTEAET